MPKILCDLHHGDLYYSLQLLFEKRLGFEMYRPIGLDWYHEGYWHIFPHIDTAKQYLALDQAISTPTDCLGGYLAEEQKLNKNYIYEDGIYYVKDNIKDNVVQRAVTLEKFKIMKFDILISSMPPHIQPFNKLIQLYQPQAKHIFQVGNAWGHLPGVKNILASTARFPVPSDVNVVFYHQEFNTSIFKYQSPTTRNRINSYIHLMRDLNVRDMFKQLLPEFTFQSYGAGMEDTIAQTKDIAKTMHESTFTWHWKPEGDGYGHTLHNSYACGRPAIIHSQHYQGKLGSMLMEHGKTCIDLSKDTPQQIARLVRHYAQPEEHNQMCMNAYNRFCEVVNFDQEELLIRNFIDRLI